jgi:UDP-hydrolysing UDP-N-acetyl-D-glucosamine 2-epimerase
MNVANEAKPKMKIALLSTGRADIGALDAVRSELNLNGAAAIVWRIGSSPHYDTPHSIALAAASVFNETIVTLSENKPDVVVIVGDRYEALAAAQAAYLLKYPIIHLSGGDLTEGSQDDSMRHAITKLAHMHFVTNKASADRVIKMGEEPWRVHLTGYPGLDNLSVPLSQAHEELYRSIKPDSKFLLVVWHPNTLGNTVRETDELLRGLVNIHNMGIVLLEPNRDAGHDYITKVFEEFARVRENTHYWGSLPRPVYLKLLKDCEVLVGNSSSGYYEAPAFKTNVLDVGDRQKGRIPFGNFKNCPAEASAIKSSLESSFPFVVGSGERALVNPYIGSKSLHSSSYQIASTILSLTPEAIQTLLRKKWHDVQQDLGQDTSGEGVGALPQGGNGPLDQEKLRSGPVQLTLWSENPGFGVRSGGSDLVPVP